jgi:hypothetical protein
LRVIGLEQEAHIQDARPIGVLEDPVTAWSNDGALHARAFKRASGDRHDKTAATSCADLVRGLRLESQIHQKLRLQVILPRALAPRSLIAWLSRRLARSWRDTRGETAAHEGWSDSGRSSGSRQLCERPARQVSHSNVLWDAVGALLGKLLGTCTWDGG